jgi:DNA-binding GntR family transcriptional regulator
VDIQQLLEVQGVLEGLAGEIDCAVATDDQLQEVIALHQEMERISAASDPLDFFNLDMTFHRLIVEISGNAPLIGTHATYNARLYRARFISSRRPNGRPTTLAQHAEIAEALTARDVDRARAAFRSHLRSTGLNIAAARVESANLGLEIVRR